jgi:hypothetical protein
MDISQFGQRGAVPFIDNCGGFPNSVNARNILTFIDMYINKLNSVENMRNQSFEL